MKLFCRLVAEPRFLQRELRYTLPAKNLLNSSTLTAALDGTRDVERLQVGPDRDNDVKQTTQQHVGGQCDEVDQPVAADIKSLPVGYLFVSSWYVGSMNYCVVVTVGI